MCSVFVMIQNWPSFHPCECQVHHLQCCPPQTLLNHSERQQNLYKHFLTLFKVLTLCLSIMTDQSMF